MFLARYKIIHLILFLTVLILSPIKSSAEQLNREDYTIGKGDKIKITILQGSDEGGVYAKVSDEVYKVSLGTGEIEISVLGLLKVAGLKCSELEDILTEKLKDYIIEPNIKVSIKEFTIYIMGQVGKPGMYSIARGTTIIEAINMAGGFGESAAKHRIRILRKGLPKKKKYLKVNLLAILKGDTSGNIVLEPGDIVIVPETWF